MKAILVLLLIPAGVLAGLPQAAPTESEKPAAAMMMACPMNLQGATVALSETAKGIAATFTTKNGDVAELRRRVEAMSTMHTMAQPNEAMMQGRMMPGIVKYETVKNGARLTLTPKDSTQVDQFRTQVRAHVEKMQKGECSMMQHMMHGKSGAGKP